MANTTSIIPFIRSNEIVFDAINLKPGKVAHFFFDGTNVDKFVQKASVLTTDSLDASRTFVRNEGLYCSNTKAYATVISTSSNNIIYINDNYVSLNVTTYGATPFNSDDFKKGDVIFTSPNASSDITANTYSARVQYFNSTDKILVVRSLSGVANSVTTIRSLYNLGSGKRANIVGVMSGTRFPSGNLVVSALNLSNTFSVNVYTHNHGTISILNANPNTLELASPPPTTALSNTIYITSGSGLSQSFKIDSISGNTVSNSSYSSTSIRGDSTYSLSYSTVDNYGKLAGILQLPETDTYKFKTGQRQFVITDTLIVDDADNQMRAAAEYVAAGLLQSQDKVQEKITPVVPPAPPSPPENRFTTTPQFAVQRGRGDPVAQTFFTPQTENGNGLGIFVSSVDLFFKNKPNTVIGDPELPVSVKIVKVQNGYPTQEIVAELFVECKNVNTTNGLTTFPSVSDSTTLTKFRFKDPVYLPPGEEYALVVYSDSPSYEVWISELGQAVLGDANNRRVSEQPYTGSFFRSQNASTWTAFQNENLMFVINKASFNTSSTGVLQFNVKSPLANVGIHNMSLHSSDIEFSNTALSYAFRSTLASTGVINPSYSAIEKNKIFNFSSDLKTSSLNTNRKRVVLAGDANSMLVQVTVGTSDNNVSPMINTERLSLIAEEYFINDGSLANSNITITNGGGQHTNIANITVTISGPQLYSTDASANANAVVVSLSSGNITSIAIVNAGRGYIESPTITIADRTAGITANATAVIVSEDGKSGGNALARYVSKKIILADGFDAGDLKLYVEGIRPQGTNIIAYYKVLSDSDPEQFNDKKWKRMYLTNDIISPDTITPIELVFQPSSVSGALSYVENNVTYPLGGSFKYFAIKLVLLAADASVPPIIHNLRAIAFPAG
jgi:hypothetical protein